MLPRLGSLHDAGQIIFFLLTNHKQDFDDAITRPGRFDLLLSVSPISWEIKRSNLHAFLEGRQLEGWEEAQELLTSWFTEQHEALEALEYSTYDEWKALLIDIAKEEPIANALRRLGKLEVIRKVNHWGDNYITLRAKNADGKQNLLRREYEEDKKTSRIQ